MCIDPGIVPRPHIRLLAAQGGAGAEIGVGHSGAAHDAFGAATAPRRVVVRDALASRDATRAADRGGTRVTYAVDSPPGRCKTVSMASWGPRRASSPLEQSRFTRTEIVRFTTVHGNEPHVSVCHLEALDYL